MAKTGTVKGDRPARPGTHGYNRRGSARLCRCGLPLSQKHLTEGHGNSSKPVETPLGQVTCSSLGMSVESSRDHSRFHQKLERLNLSLRKSSSRRPWRWGNHGLGHEFDEQPFEALIAKGHASRVGTDHNVGLGKILLRHGNCAQAASETITDDGVTERDG